jgi:glycosyltransferase involved in cell wall biosynthesis
MGKGTILWWGRSDANYSRNRILRQILQRHGWRLVDFHPKLSPLGDIEALLRRLPRPDLVWVPCFRQRDLHAARRHARRLGVPLLFDPLISSYDKQVFERRKLAEGSTAAERLRRSEGRMMQAADLLLADTLEHARFFAGPLGAAPARIHVVPVGAEEELFLPQPPHPPATPIEVLFYGSFIPLQGVETIVAAARLAPEIRWTLLGKGPLLASCVEAAKDLANVRFESWIAYDQLPQRIGAADILLGVFGTTPKAARVIPNKVYQSLACARPVITLDSGVYGDAVRAANRGGMAFVPAGDPAALAQAVRDWSASPATLAERGANARQIYDTAFSVSAIETALDGALATLLPGR